MVIDVDLRLPTPGQKRYFRAGSFAGSPIPVSVLLYVHDVIWVTTTTTVVNGSV